MADFKPDAVSLKGWLARIDRSEKRWEAWREEGKLHVSLYRGERQAWARIAPGGGITGGLQSPATAVVRNAIGQNVRTDIRKQVFKHPKFNCSPLVSEFYKQVDGKVIPVDPQLAAEAQKECLNYGFHRIKFRDTLRMVLEDTKLVGEGWVMTTSSTGFDVSEASIEPEGEETTDAQKARVKAKVQSTAVAMKSMPGVAWISWEDVAFDPDALLDGEMNWVAHKLKKPLSAMKAQMDEEVQPDGTVKEVPRYTNLDKLEAALGAETQAEREKRYHPEDLVSDLPPEEYVWYWEVHRRIPANSKVMRDQNDGKVPKTEDGFVKYIMCIAETPGAGGEPILLRWKPYDVDVKGFAMKRLVFFRYNRQARGSSIIRDYRDACANENYYMSMWATWTATNFPQVIADETIVKVEDVEKAKNAGINAWVFIRGTGGRDLKTAVTVTPTTPVPQELPALVQTFRSTGDEGSGRSANQRGQVAGVRTAREVDEVAASAGEMLADEVEQIKEFCEAVACDWMKFFIAELADSGVFEVPNGTGGFLKFNRELLDVPALFELDYTSMMREDSEVKKKQMTEFIALLSKIPPQMVEMFDPFIRRLAIAFGPDFEAAYTEFKKKSQKKDPADPDVEHLLIREGQWVEPAEDEDFTKTIPAHKEHLASVLTDPTMAMWKKPQVASDGREYVPFELLSQHIQMSIKYAEKNGQLMPGMSGGGSPGMPQGQTSANDRGRGMMSGSAGQQALPDAGEIAAGAANVNTEGSGSLRGL